MHLSPDSLAGDLLRRGMERSEEAAKRALYASVIERHAALHRRSPEHFFWVPGRLEVFGKHTDYAGGRTLVCPVGRGLAVAVSARDDRVVQIADARREEAVTIPLLGKRAVYSGWRAISPAPTSAPTSRSPAICPALPA